MKQKSTEFEKPRHNVTNDVLVDIEKAILKDELTVFRSMQWISQPSVTISEIVGMNGTIQLKTFDNITHTPRRFKVTTGSTTPDVKMYINDVDPIELALATNVTPRRTVGQYYDIPICDIKLNLNDHHVVNEIISVIHLRQIIRHIWKECCMDDGYDCCYIGDIINSIFFYPKKQYNVDFIGFGQDAPLRHEIMLNKTILYTILYPDNGTIPDYIRSQHSLGNKTTGISTLEGFLTIVCKVIRSLSTGQPINE